MSKGHTAGEEPSGDSNTGRTAWPARSTPCCPGTHTAGAVQGLAVLPLPAQRPAVWPHGVRLVQGQGQAQRGHSRLAAAAGNSPGAGEEAGGTARARRQHDSALLRLPGQGGSCILPPPCPPFCGLQQARPPGPGPRAGVSGPALAGACPRGWSPLPSARRSGGPGTLQGVASGTAAPQSEPPNGTKARETGGNPIYLGRDSRETHGRLPKPAPPAAEGRLGPRVDTASGSGQEGVLGSPRRRRGGLQKLCIKAAGFGAGAAKAHSHELP